MFETLKNLFQKASSVQPMISLSMLGQPVWSQRRYKDFSDEGYKKCVIAYKCINMRSRAIGATPFALVKITGSGKQEEITEHPILDLLRRPNLEQSKGLFFMSLNSYRDIAGNAYVEVVGPDGKPPQELHLQRPDRMAVIPGNSGVAGYEFEVNGVKKTWEQDPLTGETPILHWRTFNPLDDWYGLSPLEAAAFDVDLHTGVLSWNKSLLDNSAQTSGALCYDPKDGLGNLTQDQRDTLKTELDNHKGPGNAGRPMLLDGGLKWVPMGLTPQQMDYIESKNTSARDIALAFDVPPVLLGLPNDSTFNNQAEANLSFAENTTLPLQWELVDELNNWLVPKFQEEGLRLVVDEDRIPALAQRRNEMWDRLEKTSFLTDNEKREKLNYKKLGHGADVLYKQSSMVPVSEPSADDEKAKIMAALERVRNDQG